MKFVVDETDQVSQLRQAVADAGRVAGMRSAYRHDTAWTVTVLEGISDEIVEPECAPFELYVADRFMLSRVVGPGTFDVIDTIALASPTLH